MKAGQQGQRGAAAVEFALVFVLLVVLLFGFIEVGRVLFTWNSAVQATRAGARTAAIVAIGNRDAVLARMRESMPDLRDDQVDILYSRDGTAFGPAGTCARGTCVFVRVAIRQALQPAATATPWGRFLPDTLAMPDFATTVPVEALGAT